MNYYEQTCVAMNKFHKKKAQEAQKVSESTLKENAPLNPKNNTPASSTTSTPRINPEVQPQSVFVPSLGDLQSRLAPSDSPTGHDPIASLIGGAVKDQLPTPSQQTPEPDEHALEWTSWSQDPNHHQRSLAFDSDQVARAITAVTQQECLPMVEFSQHRNEAASQTETEFEVVMRQEIATVTEAICKEQLELRQRLLQEQAAQFAEERYRLMERVRVAEAQRHSALEKQHDLVEHHKKRAETAEKKLASCRLRLAGRAMMAMARQMQAKVSPGRRSARHILLGQETTPKVMLRSSTTASPPKTAKAYTATARGSPVHLGVALPLSTPEWHVRCLRHMPIESDLQRLVAHIIGSKREWLTEFAALGGQKTHVPYPYTFSAACFTRVVL